jgi:hypothetical protein
VARRQLRGHQRLAEPLGCGGLERHDFRHALEVRGGRQGALGDAAVALLADDLVAVAHGLHPAPEVGAATADHARVHNRIVAGVPADIGRARTRRTSSPVRIPQDDE